MSLLPLSRFFHLQGHKYNSIVDFDNLVATLELIQRTKREMCYVKHKYVVMKLLLEGCPGLMRDISSIGEICLHTAVGYNKGTVIQLLVQWVSKRTLDYAHLINTKDCCGYTILHLATSRKQLQTLKVLTKNPTIRNLVDVETITHLVDVNVNVNVNANAINSGRFTTLDIQQEDVILPYSGKIDVENGIILQGAGAFRGRDKANKDASNHAVQGCRDTMKCTSRFGILYAYCVMLLTATMLATITYQASFSAFAGTFKDSYTYYSFNMNSINGNLQPRKSDSIVTHSFVMFNSMGFIASVAMIIFLLHEFPLKPWPQITILAMFGSYMCLIKAISPDEALPLLLLSIPFLLLAAAGKKYGFARQRS